MKESNGARQSIASTGSAGKETTKDTAPPQLQDIRSQSEKEQQLQRQSVPVLPNSSREQEKAKLAQPSGVKEMPAPPLHVSTASPSLTPTATPTSSPPGKKKSRPIAWVAAICFVVLISAAVLYVLLNISSANVTVFQVGVQNIDQHVGGGGIVFPNQQLDLSYPIAERAVNVLVKPGDQVIPNQPLIQLDPSQLTIEIKQASDEVAAAQAYLMTVSSSVSNAATIAQAQQQYNLAKSRYNAIVASTTTPILHHGFLISTIHGVVTSVNINSGEVFAADTTLLTIMDESTVIVHAKIPLSNLQQIYLGEPAIVTPSALPDLTFNGTVTAIVPQADPQTDTFEIWVSIVNPYRALLPGMSAFVSLQNSKRAFVVPRLAVLNPDHGSEVFVVRDDHVYLQHVHMIGRSTTTVFIGSGLSSGDKIVLVGLDSLQNGQQVHVTDVESRAS
jgi:RND family efflux transporter MFP subunit